MYLVFYSALLYLFVFCVVMLCYEHLLLTKDLYINTTAVVEWQGRLQHAYHSDQANLAKRWITLHRYATPDLLSFSRRMLPCCAKTSTAVVPITYSSLYETRFVAAILVFSFSIKTTDFVAYIYSFVTSYRAKQSKHNDKYADRQN